MKIYKKFLNKHGIPLDNETTAKLFRLLYKSGFITSRYKSDHDIYEEFIEATRKFKSQAKALIYIREKHKMCRNTLLRIRQRIASLD